MARRLLYGLAMKLVVSALLVLAAACTVSEPESTDEPLDSADPALLSDVPNAFAAPKFNNLTVVVNGVGFVTQTVSPVTATGSSCGTGCTRYPSSATVTLSAASPTGWVFVGWSGSCTGVGPCTLAMTTARSVTATFVMQAYTLQVGVQGAQGFSNLVMSMPGGIACPGSCVASFPAGQLVTLDAVPVPGWQFVGWSGPCVGTGACTISMSSSQGVTAMYAPVLQPVTIAIASPDNAADVIVSNSGGLACSGGQCSGSLLFGTFVTLTAVAAPSDRFVSWPDGPCAGSQSPTCSFQVNGPVAMTASFDWFATLTILPNAGQDTILAAHAYATDGSIACTSATYQSGTCTAHYAQGQTVSLDYSWGGSCTFPYLGPVYSLSGDCLDSGSGTSCSLTFTNPGSYTSELDVGCIQYY